MADPYASFSTPAGAAADPYAAFSKPAPGAAKPDVKRGMQDSFFSGMLMNFGDEVKAGIRATVGPDLLNRYRELDKKAGLPGLPEPSKASDWKGRYDEELNTARADAKAFAKENPTLDTASNVVGNVAGSAALLAAGPAGLSSMGPSLTLNALKLGAVGGGLGAVSGYGSGEGESDRAENALIGGGVGAATGFALPFIGRGARLAYDRVAPKVLQAAGNVAEKFVPRVRAGSLSAAAPDGSAGIAGDSVATRFSDSARNAATKIEDDAALNRLAIAMSDRGGPQAARQRMNALGEGAFIADANKGTERLAFVTQANSDDAAESMLKSYTARNKATGTRFKAAVPGAPDARSADDFLNSYTSAEGSKIYDPVLRQGKLTVSDELTALSQRPSIKKALETVDEWAAAEGKALTDAERFHMVKQALNQNSDAAFASGKPINKKMVGDTAAEWEAALYRANPEIQAADRAYAKVASLPDHFERGRNFAAQGRNENALNASPEALRADLPNMTLDQRNVLAAGARSDMRRIASQGPDQTRRLAKSLTDGDDMVDRLREILGDDVAERIISRSEAERTYAEKFGNVMRGSPTAERNMTLMRDQGIGPPASGDVMSVLRWVRDQADKLDRPSETVRRKLADLLTNPDAAANAETIALVEGILRRRASGNALRSSVPAAVGGAASGP